MDAFSVAFSYAIMGIKKQKIILFSIFVGFFHFLMPYLGSILGEKLYYYCSFNINLIMFFVFFIISLDMFLEFIKNSEKKLYCNNIFIILTAISVSIDSFAIGFGINYLYDAVLLSCFVFSIFSFLFCILGFLLGKKLSYRLNRYSFLVGGTILLALSIKLLTN